MIKHARSALLLVAALAGFGSPALAGDTPGNIRDSISFEGKCSIQLAKADVPCNGGAALFHLKNDRTVIFFGSPVGMFAVAGTEEAHAEGAVGRLAVDLMRIRIEGKEELVDSNMEGECLTSVGKDGARIEAIRCELRDKVKKSRFRLSVTDIAFVERKGGEATPAKP